MHIVFGRGDAPTAANHQFQFERQPKPKPAATPTSVRRAQHSASTSASATALSVIVIVVSGGLSAFAAPLMARTLLGRTNASRAVVVALRIHSLWRRTKQKCAIFFGKWRKSIELHCNNGCLAVLRPAAPHDTIVALQGCCVIFVRASYCCCVGLKFLLLLLL